MKVNLHSAYERVGEMKQPEFAYWCMVIGACEMQDVREAWAKIGFVANCTRSKFVQHFSDRWGGSRRAEWAASKPS